MAKYKLLGGRHEGPGARGETKQYGPGDIVESDKPLDKMFPNSFERVGTAKMKKARHAASPDEDDLPELSDEITAANFDNVSPVDDDDDEDHPPTMAAKKKAREHAEEDTVEPEDPDETDEEDEEPAPRAAKEKPAKSKDDKGHMKPRRKKRRDQE